ncbi:MAG: type VI secretion system-associated FHA domain protein, partial [Shimia sp.]
MDILTLRIENHKTLETGGPVQITLHGKGAQVGRKSGNDWVLPDPSRHISGHHLDVSYEGGRYVLTDVSSNGTFLQGERYRLSGPHPIAHGDRFTVGRYILRAEITAGGVIGTAEPADVQRAPATLPR